MLEPQKKIKLLEKIITKSKEITVRKSNDPKFKEWKTLVERTFIKIFGDESYELEKFREFNFFYYGIRVGGVDYSQNNLRNFNNSFETTINLVNSYIEEFKEEFDENEYLDIGNKNNYSDKILKIFISHSHLDKNVVEEIIDSLENIGIKSNQIFCSSFDGYGVKFGEDFLERIKNELNQNVLVLFVLSENFYKSPICLCEMGATWARTSLHIPILIPPFDFKDIKGVIPLTHGFKINQKEKLNSFKTRIEEIFKIENKIDYAIWERKRDRMISRIDDSN